MEKQLNTSNPTSGLKPAVPNGKEAPRIPSRERKHSAKIIKENAETTAIIIANATLDDGVWHISVPAATIAGIATVATGRTITDDTILRLCAAYTPGGISVLKPGWQRAGTGRPSEYVKTMRIIEGQPGLCQRLDFQFETQKEMDEWLDWEGPKACVTKHKNETLSDGGTAAACRSLYYYDPKSCKLVLYRYGAGVTLSRHSYGLPLSVHLIPASCRPVARAGDSNGAAGTGNTRAGRQGGRQQQI